MRALKILLVLILVSSTMEGQTAPRKELRVRIESISPTSFGFNIVASVTNLGSHPVTLAEAAGPHRGTLQSLNVEQWDEKLGWQEVGPCRDVLSELTISLQPNETIRNTIPISDTSHGWKSSVCPRKITHLGGKVRSILYYVYENEEKYQNRMIGRDVNLVNIFSTPVELPTAQR
jgi:hypothetical protein